MPPFPKPRTSYDYDLEDELAAIRAHRGGRGIPARESGSLLIATWNVANLGLQQRREKDLRLLAEMMGWFDLVTVQEVANDLTHLYALRELIRGPRELLISDTAGNDECAAFIYDPRKVEQCELVGRLSVPPSDYGDIRLPGITQEFQGFDRSPYLAAFRAGDLTLLFASVHLIFGSDDDPQDIARRSLETYALARWADLLRKRSWAYTKNIVALGDFNMPALSEDDPIYKALTSRGLKIPEHTTIVGGSSLGGHHHYDQVAVFPGTDPTALGVFDFDTVIFKELWDSGTEVTFRGYVRYFVSDHRLLWAEFPI
jgi:endonuclease/exonuclease/phosphatase family metal-dependent hydrolase